MPTETLQLEPFIAGDHWQGITSRPVMANGPPPQAQLIFIRIRFEQTRTAYPAPIVEISSSTSSVVILDPFNWVFSAPTQPMPWLTAGFWNYIIQTTDENGIASTYIEGSIVVKKGIQAPYRFAANSPPLLPFAADGPVIDQAIKTAPFTPNHRGVYQFDVTAGSFEIQAPIMAPNQWFTLIDATPGKTGNFLTVSFVAELLNGVQETYLIGDGSTGSAVTFAKASPARGFIILNKSSI
jgi:hypothetical protein